MCVVRWFAKVDAYSHGSHLFGFEQIAVQTVQIVQIVQIAVETVQSIQVGVQSANGL